MLQRPYRHCLVQLWRQTLQGRQQEQRHSPDCSSSLCSACSPHHHQTPCQTPCWQQLLKGDVLRMQPASSVTGKPKHSTKHSSESKLQLPGSTGVGPLQQVVRHHPLLLQEPSQQQDVKQQQQQEWQQQELQQQTPRDPVQQRWHPIY